MGQTFFLLEGPTAQPICFRLASSARWLAQATPQRLRWAGEILSPPAPSHLKPLLLADKEHWARNLLQGLEGEGRVNPDTLVVTLYNAPKAELWRAHYENLPHKLRQESVDPHIPWLSNFKLDFRFA